MYDFSSVTPSIRMLAGAGIWVLISLVLALIGGILIYFMFLNKENETKFTGKTKWIYDFLSFKKLFAETLLKIVYIVTALFITLSSFSMLGINFAGFVAYLIVGNVVARITYEFMLAILLICKNTTEINSKLKKDNTKQKETKKEDK